MAVIFGIGFFLFLLALFAGHFYNDKGIEREEEEDKDEQN